MIENFDLKVFNFVLNEPIKFDIDVDVFTPKIVLLFGQRNVENLHYVVAG